MSESERYRGPWADPPRESEDYPGFVVHDDRVSASITFGHTRLPIWAVIWHLVDAGWSGVKEGWPDCEQMSEKATFEFLYNLLEMRGEFGRLLLTLADAERRESKRRDKGQDLPWWPHAPSRKKIAAQLRKCLEAVESEHKPRPAARKIRGASASNNKRSRKAQKSGGSPGKNRSDARVQ